jgi:hypothetical protein
VLIGQTFYIYVAIDQISCFHFFMNLISAILLTASLIAAMIGRSACAAAACAAA